MAAEKKRVSVTGGLHAVAIPLLTLLFLPGRVDGTACGVPAMQSRIIGGSAAVPGAWPWQISLCNQGGHLCRGSLISNEWLLTSVMCFFSSSNASFYQLELGLLFKNGTGAQTVTRGLKNIFIHPNYTNYVTGNDAALRQLQQPVNYTDVIRPVCLPRKSDVFTPKDNCWVTGWGAIKCTPLPNTGPLQQLNVTIIPNADCDRMYNDTKQNASLPMILDNMMCASYAQGGKDACRGGNGGPLVSRRQTDGSWVQAGIVSWGVGCGIPNKPVIYTRVSSSTAWIQKMTNITIEEEIKSVVGSGVVRLQKPGALLALLLLLISFILSLN